MARCSGSRERAQAEGRRDVNSTLSCNFLCWYVRGNVPWESEDPRLSVERWDLGSQAVMKGLCKAASTREGAESKMQGCSNERSWEWGDDDSGSSAFSPSELTNYSRKVQKYV